MKNAVAAVLVLASAGMVCADDTGLVLSLDFDKLEGGRFSDASPARLKAVNHGATLCAGVHGHAARFGGRGSTVTADLPESFRQFDALTVEAWVGLEKLQHCVLVCNWDQKRTLDDYPFLLRWRTNWEFWLQLTCADGERRLLQCFKPVVDTIAFPKRKWYHVVGTYDGETSTMYVNGKLIRRQKFKGGRKSIRLTPTIMLGGPRVYNGALDNVRVYSRAITEKEVQSRFAARRTFKPTDPPRTSQSCPGTIDRTPYASCTWFTIPLEFSSIGLSNTGQLNPVTAPRVAYNNYSLSTISLLDQAGRQHRFYKRMTGNVEFRRDKTATLTIEGETTHGLRVKQLVDVNAKGDARVRYELAALTARAPVPRVVWNQHLWPSAWRFVGYDATGLITGNLLDLDAELAFRKRLEINLVRGGNRLVVTMADGTHYRLRGTRNAKNWVNGWGNIHGELVPVEWQGWDKTKQAVIEFTLRQEPDNLPPRLDRAKARQVTRDVPFDFSRLYDKDLSKLGLSPVDRDTPVFMDDENVAFTLDVPKELIFPTRRYTWTLSAATGKKTVHKGELIKGGPSWEWNGKIALPAPPAGVYRLEVRAIGQDDKLLGTATTEVAVIGEIPQPVGKPGQALPKRMLRKVDEVDFTAADPGHDFYSYSGRSKVVKGKHGTYRQTLTYVEEQKRSGGASWWANDWFGVRFRTEPGKVYVLETEYPDLDWMAVSTYLVEPKEDPTDGKCRPLNRTTSGVYTGGFLPHDDTMKTWQTVHFASAPWVAVTYQNGQSGHGKGRPFAPASIKRVTLYEVVGELPRLGAPTDTERYIGVHCESGGLALGSFGVKKFRGSLADWRDPPPTDRYYEHLYPTVVNLIKYMRYRGDNVLFAGVYRYRPAQFPSRTFPPAVQAVQHDLPAFYARMFERNGITLVPTVMPCNPLPTARLHEHTRHDIIHGASGTVSVDADGTQITPSYFAPTSNPFHPKVREAYGRLAAELGQRYGRYAAVPGIAWIAGSAYWEPGVPINALGVPRSGIEKVILKFTYDDETMRQFEQWAKVKLPGKVGEADRYRRRHDWIMKHAKQKFVDFRGWATAQTHLAFKDAFRSAAPNKDYLFIDYYGFMVQSEIGHWSPLEFCRLCCSNPTYLRGPGFVHMPYYPEANARTLWEHGRMRLDWMPQITRFLADDELARAWDTPGRSARYVHRQFYEQGIPLHKGRPWFWAPDTTRLATCSYPQQGDRGYWADFAIAMARGTPNYVSYMWCDSLIPMGHEPEHRAVAAAFRSLPPGHYREADRKDGVFCRYLDGKRKAVYVVNTNGRAIDASLKVGLPGQFVDAVSGEPLNVKGGVATLRVKPYDFRVFRAK